MSLELLNKIAAAVGDEDDNAGADQQRDQIEEEGKKPEKKDKKKGKNPFAKDKNGNGEEEPSEANGQAGPVPAEGVPAEAPPAGDEAIPAAPEEQQTVQDPAAVPATPVGVSQVIDFLQANPNPEDGAVHAFAEQNGMDPHQMEQIIYGLTTKFVNFMRSGKSIDQGLDVNSVDLKELEAGIAVEMEHTPDPAIAKKIALDHLAELPDYYTRLSQMEESAKAESGAAMVPKKDDGYVDTEGKEETKEMDPNQPVGANNRAEI